MSLHTQLQKKEELLPGNKKSVVRVVGKWLTFHAPHSITLLATCLFDARPPSPPGGERTVRVAVEAVGSGTVVVPALEVGRKITVGALKAEIERFLIDAPLGALQLSLGHGTAWFEDDGAQPFATDSVWDGDMPPLVVSHSMPSDRDVLMVLYDECSGTGWRRQTNWGSDTAPLSRWSGVKVDEAASSGRIIELALSGCALRGRWWFLHHIVFIYVRPSCMVNKSTTH